AGPRLLLPANGGRGRVAADGPAGAGEPAAAAGGGARLLRRLLAVRRPGGGTHRPGVSHEALGRREGRPRRCRVDAGRTAGQDTSVGHVRTEGGSKWRPS